MSKYIIVISILLALVIANIFCGSVYISPQNVVDVLCGRETDLVAQYIIMQSRIPQTLTAFFAGIGLSVAGLLLQTIFHNPLAGPSILGISGGSSLGVAIVMMLAGGTLSTLSPSTGFSTYIIIALAAVAGAIGVTSVLLVLSSLIRNNLVLLVTGMMIGYIVSSMITIITYSADESGIQQYVLWGMGDFSTVSWKQLPWLAGSVFVMTVLCFPMSKSLNAYQLGAGYADSLGISVKGLRCFTLVATGILTAAITAFCGPVSFLGLAVPHIARFIIRTEEFKSLLIFTILTGAGAALTCNILCTSLTSTVMPLSAVTPIIGVPVIMWVIFGKKVSR